MSLITAAAEAVHHVELPMPSIMYGVIAVAGFLILGIVTWSFRDVAMRHPQKFGTTTGHDEHVGH